MSGIRAPDLSSASDFDEALVNINGDLKRISKSRLVGLLASVVGPSYQTRAQLYADLAWPAGAVAGVWGDATAAYNGNYKKSGGSGSGSWSRIGDLAPSTISDSKLALKADKTVVDGLAAAGNALYRNRADAVSAAPGLPAGIGRLMDIEGSALVIRGRSTTTDDPLFATGDQWGVMMRIDMASALRDTGLITLTNIAGTANAITAAMPAAAKSNGVTTTGSSTIVEIIPTLTNTTNTPTLSIDGGAAVPIRSEAGGQVGAGQFMAGRSYLLRRRGTSWYLVAGGAGLADLLAEQAARLSMTAEAGTVMLTNIGGTSDAITADIPASLPALSAGSLNRIRWQPVTVNTGQVTLSIGGTVAVHVRDIAGGGLAAGHLQPGRIYEAVKVGNMWRIVSGDLARIDQAVAPVSAPQLAWMGAQGALWCEIVDAPTAPNTLELVPPTINGASAYPTYRRLRAQVRYDTTAIAAVRVAGTSRALVHASGAALANGYLRAGDIIEIEFPATGNAILRSVSRSLEAYDRAERTVREAAPRAVEQVAAALPARPADATYCMWYCWSDPTALMATRDVWIQMPPPALPDAPTITDLYGLTRLASGLDRSTGLIMITVPDLFPKLTNVSYRIDGGPWTLAGLAAPGQKALPALTVGQHDIQIAWHNYMGRGGASVERRFTVHSDQYYEQFNYGLEGQAISARDNWSRTGTRDLIWQSASAGAWPSGLRINGNNVRGGGFCDTILSAAQFAEITVDQNTDRPDPLVSLEATCIDRLYMLTVSGQNWSLSGGGIDTSGLNAGIITSARLEVTPTHVRAIVNGTLAHEAVNPSPGTVGRPGIWAKSAQAADQQPEGRENVIRSFRAGVL